MANDFVADPMNRVKPGDIVSVRVISVDEPRGRIGFSMKPEAQKSEGRVKPAASVKTKEANTNPDKGNRSKDKRSAPRGKRADKERRGASNQPNRTSKPKAETPSRIGTLGALLQEAGVTKKK